MSRIVVVDDSKFMCNLLTRFLEGAGHEVFPWEELAASEVGGRVREDQPDLVITDFQMPRCNGLTVARMARLAKPGLPVVVLTATHDPMVMEALRRQEVSCILHKPLSAEALLEAVRDVL